MAPVAWYRWLHWKCSWSDSWRSRVFCREIYFKLVLGFVDIEDFEVSVCFHYFVFAYIFVKFLLTLPLIPIFIIETF